MQNVFLYSMIILILLLIVTASVLLYVGYEKPKDPNDAGNLQTRKNAKTAGWICVGIVVFLTVVILPIVFASGVFKVGGTASFSASMQSNLGVS